MEYKQISMSDLVGMELAPSPRINLVPSLRAPPSEKRSGERSQISWAYSPKVVKTNR